MKRQEVLTQENPVRLHVILGEAALRYPVGGAEVMREQYTKIEKMSGWDHIPSRCCRSAGVTARPTTSRSSTSVTNCLRASRPTVRGVPYPLRTSRVKSTGSTAGSTT
ncbi:Scr1 family TA system antitoxin-like transcriptional regulator [Streptomyces sp. NPDC057257]|uniref:Scr1 family TA system antitoxin-like transcriptional regulator n=1 Tax=Streptomyces sp. NPDC057257 TaxID=3346071 RepID=UPI0036360A18